MTELATRLARRFHRKDQRLGSFDDTHQEASRLVIEAQKQYPDATARYLTGVVLNGLSRAAEYATAIRVPTTSYRRGKRAPRVRSQIDVPRPTPPDVQERVAEHVRAVPDAGLLLALYEGRRSRSPATLARKLKLPVADVAAKIAAAREEIAKIFENDLTFQEFW